MKASETYLKKLKNSLDGLRRITSTPAPKMNLNDTEEARRLAYSVALKAREIFYAVTNAADEKEMPLVGYDDMTFD